MPPENDRIFAEPQAQISAFQFDRQVAEVFDDMIRRSVPGYETLVQMLAVLARRYAQPGTRVYDLGCSLGTGLIAMRHAVGRSPIEWVGIDSSPAMVERCRARVEQDLALGGFGELQLMCEDVRRAAIENASLVVMNFTLQFVPPADRRELLERIHRALRPGGALVLSEKVDFQDGSERQLFEGLHDEFRKHNGYSELEISQKRAALEDVLFPEAEPVHIQRLTEAGFQRSHCWFRCCNFSSFLALR